MTSSEGGGGSGAAGSPPAGGVAGSDGAGAGGAGAGGAGSGGAGEASAASDAAIAAAAAADTLRGLGGAAIAVCAWSTGTILAKYIDLGGLVIGAYRFTMFAVAAIAFLAWRRTPFTWSVMRYSAFGGIALGLDVALFFSAVKLTTIVNATIIGSLQPILVGVVAARFFGEKIRAQDALWSIVALAGVVVVVAGGRSEGASSLQGDLLAALAMFAWSAYFIASKQSKSRMTPMQFTTGTAVWTALICAPLAVAFGQDMSLPSWQNLAWVGVMTVSAGMIGHNLMNWSLVRIPLWVGSTFTLLIPVFSALLAWLFLDEAVTAVQGAAMAVVIAALAVIVRGQSKPAAAPPTAPPSVVAD